MCLLLLLATSANAEPAGRLLQGVGSASANNARASSDGSSASDQAGVNDGTSCLMVDKLVDESLFKGETDFVARYFAALFLQGGNCSGHVADVIASRSSLIGCSALTTLMIDTSVLTVTHQGASSLANTLPNFSKLVTALRDCLSPQQVFCSVTQGQVYDGPATPSPDVGDDVDECKTISNMVTDSLNKGEINIAARLISSVFVQGDKCAGYLADTISVGNNALGCSNLMQALSGAYSVAYSNDRGSAFASIISGLSTLVATVRACLSPQQVACFATLKLA